MAAVAGQWRIATGATVVVQERLVAGTVFSNTRHGIGHMPVVWRRTGRSAAVAVA